MNLSPRKSARALVAQAASIKLEHREPVAEAAKRCAQYYMNNRWLGGTLTNWRTVSGSIARLRELETILANGGEGRVKKELLNLQREKDKLSAEDEGGAVARPRRRDARRGPASTRAVLL